MIGKRSCHTGHHAPVGFYSFGEDASANGFLYLLPASRRAVFGLRVADVLADVHT